MHVFGRNGAKVDTLLLNADASQIHMVIAWNGQQWHICDHSRNGTFIDGKALVANVKIALQVGQKIQCAYGGESIWEVLDLKPPCAMLMPMNVDTPAIELKTFHFIPNETNALATVYLSENEQWIWDSATETRILNDSDIVQAGTQVWQCAMAHDVEQTVDIRTLEKQPLPSTVIFDFLVSQNEEHIYLTLDIAGGRIDLGERTHHYSLLTLARRRFEDFRRGLDEFSQGWLPVEDLAKMLGMEQTHVNTQLFRARTQIVRGTQGKLHLPDAIERRRGEVRFSACPFRIMRGKQLEASFEGY
ncbi:MAG: FHA domain-containing protein [Undibacterium sp.]|nr:FHA domain-containing protein [Undibacterium sp.]